MILEDLFKTVTEMSFISSVIILIIMVLRLLFKQNLPKSLPVCLWAVVIFKLLVPFDIPSPVSMYNRLDVKGQLTEIIENEKYEEPVEIITNDPGMFALPVNGNQNAQMKPVYYPPVEAAGVTDDSPHTDAGRPVKLFNLLSVLWFLIFAVMTLGLSAMYLVTLRRVKSADPVQNDFTKSFLEEQKLRCGVRLCSISGLSSPVMFGILKPVLVFPQDFDFDNQADLRYILTHEVQHIKRLDNLWNLFMLFSLCLHWFNPLVWATKKLFLKDIESACDAGVMNRIGEAEKQGYATAIVNAASSGRNFMPAFVVGFGETNAKERVRSVMKHKKASWLSILSGCIILTLIVTVCATGVNAKDDKNPDARQNIKNSDAITPNASGKTQLFPSESTTEAQASETEEPTTVQPGGNQPADKTVVPSTESGISPAMSLIPQTIISKIKHTITQSGNAGPKSGTVVPKPSSPAEPAPPTDPVTPTDPVIPPTQPTTQPVTSPTPPDDGLFETEMPEWENGMTFQNGSDNILMTVKTDKTYYAKNDTVNIAVSIRNTSDHDITLIHPYTTVIDQPIFFYGYIDIDISFRTGTDANNKEDTDWSNAEKYLLLLKPGEEIVQICGYNPSEEYHHDTVEQIEVLPGIYNGNAEIHSLDGKVYSLDFTVEIK